MWRCKQGWGETIRGLFQWHAEWGSAEVVRRRRRGLHHGMKACARAGVERYSMCIMRADGDE